MSQLQSKLKYKKVFVYKSPVIRGNYFPDRPIKIRRFFFVLAFKSEVLYFPLVAASRFETSDQIKFNGYISSIWHILKYFVVAIMFRSIVLSAKNCNKSNFRGNSNSPAPIIVFLNLSYHDTVLRKLWNYQRIKSLFNLTASSKWQKKKKISDRPGVLEKADPGDRKLTHF